MDLSSDDSASATIRGLVSRVAGRADQAATLRAELRANIKEIAEQARSAGAREFYFAAEIAPLVPISATLSVFLPEWDLDRLDELGIVELESVLRAGTSAMATPALGERTVNVPEVAVVRRRYRRVVNREREGLDPVPIFQVDYWVAAAHPARLALMSFSSPMMTYEEDLVELFDAIVKTTRWPGDDDSRASAALS
ncbi:MAG: hypothetical protein RIA38_00240 [Microcella pacifica]|uniref:hypothetical protein n=1 Tax=Microcella pacifica TaxID=2591847 RepID=UPI0033163660